MDTLSFHKIDTLEYPVYFGNQLWDDIHAFLQHYFSSGQVFLLTDTNTRKFCLPVILRHVDRLENHPLITVTAGEEHKNIETLSSIWQQMIDLNVSKGSLLINLGGGVVSDMGGFAAAAIKRGIDYINIPTSLIGQADAAVGGKTAVNVSGVKNQVGLFYDPAAVFIIPGLLETLPAEHIVNGMAEIIKSAILAGNGLWETIKEPSWNWKADIPAQILQAVRFKCDMVANDPFDENSRQMLNFGHTVGHALESYFNHETGPDQLHGEAVASGMVCEAVLSGDLAGMDHADLMALTAAVKRVFALRPISGDSYEAVWKLMLYDKKNADGNVNFSLLQKPGKPCLKLTADKKSVFRSFDYYNKII